MDEFSFFENLPTCMIKYADRVNFSYHINCFDFPTRHSHKDYWEFCIILEGTLNNCTNGEVFSYHAGDVLVFTTKDTHYILNGSKDPLRYINIIVKEKYCHTLLETIAPKILNNILLGHSQFSLESKVVNEIESILLNIEYQNFSKLERNQDLLRSAFLILISSLIISIGNYSKKSDLWIENLNRIIRENNYLELTTHDLCVELNYSRVHLTALFKRHFNMTPHDYLQHLKFDHATYLLTNTKLSASAIAEKLGYANPAAFYVAFKKLYGMTPLKYKKQLILSTEKENQKQF